MQASARAAPGPAAREAGPAAAGRRRGPCARRPTSPAFECAAVMRTQSCAASPEAADHANSREQLQAAWWVGRQAAAASYRRCTAQGLGASGYVLLLRMLGAKLLLLARRPTPLLLPRSDSVSLIQGVLAYPEALSFKLRLGPALLCSSSGP